MSGRGQGGVGWQLDGGRGVTAEEGGEGGKLGLGGSAEEQACRGACAVPVSPCAVPVWEGCGGQKWTGFWDVESNLCMVSTGWRGQQYGNGGCRTKMPEGGTRQNGGREASQGHWCQEPGRRTGEAHRDGQLCRAWPSTTSHGETTAEACPYASMLLAFDVLCM